jgi:hypothetical protein
MYVWFLWVFEMGFAFNGISKNDSNNYKDLMLLLLWFFLVIRTPWYPGVMFQGQRSVFSLSLMELIGFMISNHDIMGLVTGRIWPSIL